MSCGAFFPLFDIAAPRWPDIIILLLLSCAVFWLLPDMPFLALSVAMNEFV
jgi:hypothetical protein